MRHIWLFLVPALLGLAAPAEARPRDDALTGAIRCAAVPDSHQWLDCYYGAAQAVRAALGLAPALAAQLKLAAAPRPGGAPRDETVRDDVVSAAAGCARVTGDRPWLDCYYAAAMPMRAQLGLSTPQTAARPAPIPQLASVTPHPARPVTPAGPPPIRRNSGLFTGIFSTAKPIVRNMQMQSFVKDSRGAFTVTLGDGQVWEQLDEDEIYHPARWRKDASQMQVTITPDAMHIFVLTIAGENQMYKVRRIH
jgi:hypothetical protein